jgi:quercetin dioxygenase-like cupin family protein
MSTPPIVAINCVANLFVRQMHFAKAGDTELGHTHAFNHMTLLSYGSLRVTVEGVATTFVAPHIIYIHKDKQHELVALEDNTVAYCVHALRDGNGVDDIIDPASIPKGVNPLHMAKPLMGQ